MRKLLNTLYITTPNLYLGRDGENIVVKREDTLLQRFPIHILESIVCFNYAGISPGLMSLCVEHGVGVSFMSAIGRLCARLEGAVRGNVLLRRTQYRWADDHEQSLVIARLFILAKVTNQKKVIARALRDHRDIVPAADLENAINLLQACVEKIKLAGNSASLLGYEGDSARVYFSVFNHLITRQKDDFYLHDRHRRPPLDRVNAMLSFVYGLLRVDVENALSTVGLDPYVGFFHTDRPGRAGLALDMMEELRPYIGDRFVLSLINRQQIQGKDFLIKENGSVLLTDEGRRIFLDAWNMRKQENITHPFIEESIPIGLLSYTQAMLLARYLRGDLELYPPFFIT